MSSLTQALACKQKPAREPEDSRQLRKGLQLLAYLAAEVSWCR